MPASAKFSNLKRTLLAALALTLAPNICGAANAAEATDPCALSANPSSSFLPKSYYLDPDGRPSRGFGENDSDRAFKTEIQTTCQHLRQQFSVLKSELPLPACESYVDQIPNLAASGFKNMWDPRRCLASASVLNFKREVKRLLQAREPGQDPMNRAYHSYDPQETAAFLKLVDRKCLPQASMPMAEKGGCWEKEGHALMDRARAAAEAVKTGGVCGALENFSKEEKGLLSIMAVHPPLGMSCGKAPLNLDQCASFNSHDLACVASGLKALGEDYRASSKSGDTKPGTFFFTHRLAAISAEATRLSVFSRICATGMQLDALNRDSKALPAKTDAETETKCRLADIRELQQLMPDDWEEWLKKDLAKNEPDPFEQTYEPRLRVARTRSNECAECAVAERTKNPTGVDHLLKALMVPMHASLSDETTPEKGETKSGGSPGTGAPSTAPPHFTSKIKPPAAKPGASAPPIATSSTQTAVAESEAQDLALMQRLGFKVPDAKGLPPGTSSPVDPGPAKTRSVEELAKEANTKLADFDPKGAAPSFKSAAFWLETETEKRLAPSSIEKPSAARYSGWNAAVGEAIEKAREQLKNLPKDASYQQKIRTVLETLHGDYLKFYRSDKDGLVDYLDGGFGSFTAQSKFMVATLGELGLMSDASTPDKKRAASERVVLMRTLDGGKPQLHFVTFQPKSREIWDPQTNVRTIGSETPLFEPELLLHEYVDGEKERSKIASVTSESKLQVPNSEPFPPPPTLAIGPEQPQDQSPAAKAEAPGATKPAPSKGPATPAQLAQARFAMLAVNMTSEDTKKTAIKKAVELASSNLGKDKIEELIKSLPKDGESGFNLFKALSLIAKLPKDISIGDALSVAMKHPELIKYAGALGKISWDSLKSVGIEQLGELALPKGMKDLSVEGMGNFFSNPNGVQGGNGAETGVKNAGGYGNNPNTPRQRKRSYEVAPGLSVQSFLADRKYTADDVREQVKNNGWLNVDTHNHATLGSNPLTKGTVSALRGTAIVEIEFADPAMRENFDKLKTERDREKYLLSIKMRDIQKSISYLNTDEFSAALEDPRVVARSGRTPNLEILRSFNDELEADLEKLRKIAPQEEPQWEKSQVANLPGIKKMLAAAQKFEDKTSAHPEEWRSWVEMMGRSPDSPGIYANRATHLLENVAEFQNEIGRLNHEVLKKPKLSEGSTLTSVVLDGIRRDPSASWKKERYGQENRESVRAQVQVDADPSHRARKAAVALSARAGAEAGPLDSKQSPSTSVDPIFGEPAWEGNTPREAAKTPPPKEIRAQRGQSAVQASEGHSALIERAPMEEKKKVEGFVPPSNGYGKPPKIEDRIWNESILLSLIKNSARNSVPRRNYYDSVADEVPAATKIADDWKDWLKKNGTVSFVSQLNQGDPRQYGSLLGMVTLRDAEAIAESRSMPQGGKFMTLPNGKPIPIDVGVAMLRVLSNLDYDMRAVQPGDSPANAIYWFAETMKGVDGFPEPPGGDSAKIAAYMQWVLKYRQTLDFQAIANLNCSLVTNSEFGEGCPELEATKRAMHQAFPTDETRALFWDQKE